jgi:hypothetical protein
LAIELTVSSCQKDTSHAIAELIALARGMFGLALECGADLTKHGKCWRASHVVAGCSTIAKAAHAMDSTGCALRLAKCTLLKSRF